MGNKKTPETDIAPVLMTELVLPSHTNARGTIFGGVVMGWMDIAAAIASQRYARSQVVTVAVDHLHFIAPIKIGYTVKIQAQVTYTGKSSMEVLVTVDSEDSIRGIVQRATQAYFTFVALDEKGKPKGIPPLLPKTDEEKVRFQQAEKRRAQRLQWR